jgi:hypothetical protein
MTTKRDHLTKAETVTVAAIEQGVPMLAEARALVDRFHAMIRKKAEIELEPWINESKRSLIASFATGIACSRGRMGRWRPRLPSSSLSNVKCTGVPSSIIFRPGLLVRYDPWRQSSKLRQSPYWMPITPKTGSLFHAEAQPIERSREQITSGFPRYATDLNQNIFA